MTLSVALLATDADAQVAFGPKVGGNLNFLHYNSSPSQSPFGISGQSEGRAAGLGFHAGVYLNTTEDERTGFLVEALYSRRNTEHDYDYSVGSTRIKGTERVQLEYVEVPVLFNARMTGRFHLHAGGAVAVILTANASDEGTMETTGQGGGDPEPYRFKASGTKNLSMVSFDLVAGAEYEIVSGLRATMRYLRDLNNIDTTGSSDIKSSLFQLSIGYDLIGRRKE